jgi:hypothetical protein
LILQWVDDSSLANGKEDWLVFKYDVVVVVVISVIVLVIVIFGHDSKKNRSINFLTIVFFLKNFHKHLSTVLIIVKVT